MRNLVGVATAVAILFTLAQVKVGRTERPDARAIGAIRAVVTAQGAYAAINGGYAPSLEALAMPCSVGAAGFISPDLAAQPAIIGAYEVRLMPRSSQPARSRDCHGNHTTVTFYATATPVSDAPQSYPAFGVDQNGVIWMDTRGVAPKPPFREGPMLRPIQ